MPVCQRVWPHNCWCLLGKATLRAYQSKHLRPSPPFLLPSTPAPPPCHSYETYFRQTETRLTKRCLSPCPEKGTSDNFSSKQTLFLSVAAWVSSLCVYVCECMCECVCDSYVACQSNFMPEGCYTGARTCGRWMSCDNKDNRQHTGITKDMTHWLHVLAVYLSASCVCVSVTVFVVFVCVLCVWCVRSRANLHLWVSRLMRLIAQFTELYMSRHRDWVDKLCT